MSSYELPGTSRNQVNDASEIVQGSDSQASSSGERLLASHSNETSHTSNLSTPETNKDTFLSQASAPKEKASESPTLVKPAAFKEFSRISSNLPFTKEKLAESLSLEEACGFLPYLMKAKRGDLTGNEINLDQISVDLQKALGEAKGICTMLENVPKDVPENINDARVQSHRLMYLLSTSHRVFEKLERLGSALKESIQIYSKQTGDYDSCIDILLDYIVENILAKCNQIKMSI